MAKKENETKVFSVHMPRDLWAFLKTAAIKEGVTMKELIVRAVIEYKKNHKKI